MFIIYHIPTIFYLTNCITCIILLWLTSNQHLHAPKDHKTYLFVITCEDLNADTCFCSDIFSSSRSPMSRRSRCSLCLASLSSARRAARSDSRVALSAPNSELSANRRSLSLTTRSNSCRNYYTEIYYILSLKL